MNDLLKGLFEDKRKTLPWADDEFVVLDGKWRIVYTATRGSTDATVHLPGRRSVSLQALRDAGCDVTLPKRWRYER